MKQGLEAHVQLFSMFSLGSSYSHRIIQAVEGLQLFNINIKRLCSVSDYSVADSHNGSQISISKILKYNTKLSSGHHG